MKTYRVQIQCGNCNQWFDISIPIGTRVKTFSDKNGIVTCTKCECETPFGRIL